MACSKVARVSKSNLLKNEFTAFEGDIVLGDPDVINKEGVVFPGLAPERPIKPEDLDIDDLEKGSIGKIDPNLIGVEKEPLSEKTLPIDDNLQQTHAVFWRYAKKWPVRNYKYTIPYTLRSKDFGKKNRKIIESAMNEIEAINPNIEFAPFGPWAFGKGHIWFVRGDGCYSYLGSGVNTRKLSLGFGCVNQRTVVHELLHALGFEHEHSRSDRDNHVKIHWKNIEPEMRFAFERLSKRASRNYGSYDRQSIMHYPSDAFCIRNPTCKGLTITGRPRFKGDPVDTNLGGWTLSANDIRALRKFYAKPSVRNSEEWAPNPGIGG